ncbi:MAG: hypothetical protein JSV84_05135 [Gemmatimonadota bacterium]|nr:MAG: hypothetical protein JSV84_05135 [Gemmatimonadota bacterium]
MKLTKFCIMIFIVGLSLCADFHGARAQKNPNTITFDNQSGDPALVKVIGPTGHVIEVPEGEDRTINVASGEYYILICYGSEPGKYTYAKGDTFRVVETATQYSAIGITLHRVVGGDYPVQPIPPEEFDQGTVAQAKSVSKSVTVVFEDSVEVEVNDWTFLYRFGASDTLVDLFTYTERDTTDLRLHIGSKTEHGVTVDDERAIPGDTIESIEFVWDDRKEYVQEYVIRLVDGEILRLPDLRPAKGLLTRKRYFFGAGLCPCIYLRGEALVEGKRGNFEIRLNKLGQGEGERNEPGDRVTRIHFLEK